MNWLFLSTSFDETNDPPKMEWSEIPSEKTEGRKKKKEQFLLKTKGLHFCSLLLLLQKEKISLKMKLKWFLCLPRVFTHQRQQENDIFKRNVIQLRSEKEERNGKGTNRRIRVIHLVFLIFELVISILKIQCYN